MKTTYIFQVCAQLYLVVGLVSIWQGVHGGIFSRDALYTSKDDVTLVNVTTFHSVINGRQNAWLFQFFNQWCGHCVQFSKTYIQLANIVKPWSAVISLGALDCAESANLEICRNFSATAFPTLKFFPTNMDDNDRGDKYTGTRSVEDLKQAMIAFVSSQEARPVDTWPLLSSVRNLNVNNMWNTVPANVNNVAIILEAEESFLGREVILGTLHLRDHTTVFRGDIDSSNFKDLKTTKGPILIIADRQGKLQNYIDNDNSVSGYIQYLEDAVKNYTQINEPKPDDVVIPNVIGGQKSFSSQNTMNKEIDVDLNQVYLQDMENVISYAYGQEVALHQIVSGEKLDALKSFTSVLAKYLPARKKIKLLLCHLNVWLDEQKTEITSTQLQNKLKELQAKYKCQLKMKKWMGCRGSQTFYRGYPCGLWTTFHTLTVNNYHINGKDRDFNALEVLSAIRGYVINFFSCERCVKHFTKMSANLLNEVNSPDSSVLWLWQAHNKVNARLKGDETEDPFHPKQQYPAEGFCSGCRHFTDDFNFQWNLNEVLEYLLTHYSEKTIMESASVSEDDESGPPIAVVNDEPVIKHSEWKRESVVIQELKASSDEYKIIPLSFLSRWGLGKTDISLCIFLYISSILLLFICYFFILTRRRPFFTVRKRHSLFNF